MRTKKKKPVEMPIMSEMCATCPFREDGDDPSEVRNSVMQRVLTEASQTCHSTGIAHGKQHDTHLCRGARDFQLKIFSRLGVIEAPTDEAWEERCRKMGLVK